MTATATKPTTKHAPRDRVAAWQRQQTAMHNEIGDVPKPVSMDRRQQALEDFEFFCFTYFADVCVKPWAEHHHIAARKMDQCAKSGGLFAFALPRGSLKTTLCRFKILQLALGGASLYTILLGASERAAEKRLAGIKTILCTNKLLAGDFPEVCYPIAKMDRSVRRCVGQTCGGKHTAMEWLGRHIVLPTIDGSAASGARIECYGITGEIRGTDHVLEDGRIIRPKMVFADDPQTRESAHSPSQSKYREQVLTGDVAFLNGPTETMAIVMPCTVIAEGDLAHRMLDRKQHPEWRGETHKMMDALPSKSAMKKWEEYEKILIECHDSDDDDISKATAFYKKNRRAMDRGAKPTWEHRYNEHEISAIQNAMNLYFRDREAFYAEGQNSPEEDSDSLTLRTADELTHHVSGFERGRFPGTCQQLTAFVDIQGALIYWLVAAWDQDFTGYVIDYGAFPQQRRKYYTLRQARSTLKMKFPGCDQGGQIYKGLEAVTDLILGRTWTRDDGAELKIGRMLVDANWPESTKTVRLFCRSSEFGNIILPSHGRGVKATQMPVREWQSFRRMRNPVADEWVIDRPKNANLLSVVYDTNYWKLRCHQALALDPGNGGSITFFAHSRNQNDLHRMLADNLLAERPIKTKASGRTVYEWTEKPGRDNHFFDCLVGAMVAASICGVVQPHARNKQKARRPQKRKRRNVRYHD